jgi:hypothetical protein
VSRVVRKSRAQSASEARDLLAALFTAELVRPSSCLWLVTPWISDIELLDNRTGAFVDLLPFGRRSIRLAEILVRLTTYGCTVVVATNSDQHNTIFRNRLVHMAEDFAVRDRLLIEVDSTDELHAKTLTGDDYTLTGSMNITHFGIEIREEYIELQTDPSYVARARMDMHDRFGGTLA